MQQAVCEQLVICQDGSVHKIPCPNATPATWRLIVMEDAGPGKHQPQDFFVCDRHRTQFLTSINPTDPMIGEPILIKEVHLAASANSLA